MGASGLYAFSEVKDCPVVCFAHLTNQMGNVETDLEKAKAQSSLDAFEVIAKAGKAWSACNG